MKVIIDSDTRTFVRFWLVPLGIVLVGLALYSMQTALLLIGVALFLALIINTPVSFLSKYIPGNHRGISIALSFILIISFVATLVTVMAPPILQQLIRFVDNLPSFVDRIADQYQVLSVLIDKYGLESQVDQAVVAMKDSLGSWLAGFGSNIIGGVGSAIGGVFMGFLVLVLAFLMLLEGPKLVRGAWTLYTDEAKMKYHRQMVERMYRVVTGYVIGQLTIAAIGAVITGFIVFIISLIFHEIPANLAVPSAAIYFLFTLIPMFGSTIAAIIISVLLIVTSLPAMITLVIVFLIYQQIENNVISPAIQSKYMELSALLILIAITIGIYAFGLFGAIISIPIAGCLKILFDEYMKYSRAKAEPSAEKPGVIAKLVKSKK